MKNFRRRQSLHADGSASLLFGHVEIHDDDVLNFSGKTMPRHAEITELLRNKSFVSSREPLRRSFYMQFQPEGGDRVARVEDSAQHLWFLSQERGGLPFARGFATDAEFAHYLQQRDVPLPRAGADGADGADGAARWLDIQSANTQFIGAALSHFPVTHETVSLCQYRSNAESLATHSALGYFFVNLSCGPVEDSDDDHEHMNGGDCKKGEEHKNEEDHKNGEDKGNKNDNRRHAEKSVIERRLDAAMADEPRSAVPAPVSVAVIVFKDWIITVHEKPFREMDDLLKFILENCGDRARAFGGAVQTMTSPFIFSSLFYIAVGQQLNTVSLAKKLDQLTDDIFKIEEDTKKREAVIQRIGNVRACFSEYAEELTRREHIATVLLHTQMNGSSLTRDKVVLRQLEGARAHLLRLSNEVSDSRDTVSVSNWYHNVTNTWDYLIRGNRALRQTLLFTQISNIMYPIVTLQTLYSMNVPVPFDSEGDPPVENLWSFFVVAVVVVIILLLCSRSVYYLFHKRRFVTRFLSSTE